MPGCGKARTSATVSPMIAVGGQAAPESETEAIEPDPFLRRSTRDVTGYNGNNRSTPSHAAVARPTSGKFGDRSPNHQPDSVM